MMTHRGLRKVKFLAELAHWLRPWSPAAWRIVLLLFDLATLAALLALLRAIGRSPLWAAAYWWNPLLIV